MSEASRSRRVLKFGIFEADLSAGELRDVFDRSVGDL